MIFNYQSKAWQLIIIIIVNLHDSDQQCRKKMLTNLKGCFWATYFKFKVRPVSQVL